MAEDVILLPGLEGYVYKGPTYLELNKKLKSNPLVYNLIQQNIAKRNNPTKEVVSYKDANGNTLSTTNTSTGVLSPVDPLAELYVAGKVLDPVFKVVGRAGEYGLARMGNNWARARILSRNIDNATSRFTYPVYEFLLPTSTFKPTRKLLGRTLTKSENLVASPGETIFNILPYNVINYINNRLRKNYKFFPFNHLLTYQNKRYFASARPLKNINSAQIYKTVSQDPIGLLRERVKHTPISKYDIVDTIDDLDHALGIPIRNHTSIALSFKDLRNSGGSRLLSFLNLPRYYWHVNTSPAFFRDWPGKPFILINPSLKHTFFNKGLYSNIKEQHILAHELAHSLWSTKKKHSLFLPAIPGFNFEPLPERVKNYFLVDNGNELAARGTLLKNYFGITDNTPITGDMLKYAARNYTKDIGIDNNMNLLFRSITDWDKAAEWLSKYSYKQGGKMNTLQFLKNGSGIHIKKKNRGSFTRWCGGNVTEECIRRGKASKNPKIRKKATFADNARHFKHKKGGLINYVANGDNSKNWFSKAGNWLNKNLNTISTIGNSVISGIGLLKQNSELSKAKAEKEKELNEKYNPNNFIDDSAIWNEVDNLIASLKELNPDINYGDIDRLNLYLKIRSHALANAELQSKYIKALEQANYDLLISDMLSGNTASLMELIGNGISTGLGMLGKTKLESSKNSLSSVTLADITPKPSYLLAPKLSQPKVTLPGNLIAKNVLNFKF